MNHLRDRVLVCLYLAVAVAPVVAMRLGARDARIAGVYVHPPRPALAWSAVTDERYQPQLTAWFEDRLGWKGASVHVDNSILLHVFGETKPGSNVKVGRDGVLFQPDDLYFYSKYEPLTPTLAQIDAFAAKLARVQIKLRALRRALVPVLIPSKTSVYRDAVPPEWDRALGQPRPTDELVYRAFRDALDRHGVVYVDARALLTAADTPRDHVWGRQARHWSPYGACLALREVAARYTTLTRRPLAPYPCELTMRHDAPRWHDDLDLWRLLNAWAVARAPEGIPEVATGRDVPAGTHRPDALLVGSSFTWTLVRDAQRSAVFGKLHFNYYNNTLFDWPDDKRTHTPWEEPGGTPITVGDATWRDATVDKDLYILDLLESYLIIGSYSVDFVDQLEATLGF